MIFYKVVKRNGKGLTSARSVSLNEKYKQYVVHYRTQRWSKAKIPNSKLFVFSSLDSAKAFREYSGELIYECEVINPQKATNMAYYLYDTLNFWTDSYTPEFEYVEQMNKEGVPENTYLVDKVKLIKRVK